MTRNAARASDQPAFRSIVERAASRFRAAGRSAYYFSRGKLGGDPVFAAVLRDGRIASHARIIDLGCGQGMLSALLAEAEEFDSGEAEAWPENWAPPATGWTLHGFDLRSGAIAAGQRALSDLGHRVQLSVGDVRSVPLPACDVAVILDVLHYIHTAAQHDLLARVHAALSPRGSLLLRVADAELTWRCRLTLAGDGYLSLVRGSPWPRFWCRPLAEWIALLETIGFTVTTQPMSEGTPFANVLLVATKR
jgi:SAM-dependent methyltransferase